jgi:hypothetical protein
MLYIVKIICLTYYILYIFILNHLIQINILQISFTKYMLNMWGDIIFNFMLLLPIKYLLKSFLNVDFT